MNLSVSKLVIVFLLLVSQGSVIAQVRFSKGNHNCGLPPGPERRLLDAINHRRLTEVRQLLRQGVSANVKNDCQISALTYAVAVLNVEIVKTLIAAGADVNAIDGFSKYPPLIWAIDALPHEKDEEEEAKVYEVAKLLLDAGADVNLKKESDESALTMAVLAGNEKITALLLARKAKVNDLDGKERTAYSYAAQAGFKNLKKILLAAGADPKIGVREFREEFGENAFVQAAAEGRTDIVEAMLAEGYNVNQSNQAGVTALLRTHEDSTLDVLLEAGADVNHRDNAGFTALMWAAVLNREYQVKKLIAAGADVNARSKDGRSVLSHAASGTGVRESHQLAVFIPKRRIVPDHVASGVREILIRAGARP